MNDTFYAAYVQECNAYARVSVWESCPVCRSGDTRPCRQSCPTLASVERAMISEASRAEARAGC